MRARTRAKNETHAVLVRNLCGEPPVTGIFGKAGREWLAGPHFPVDEELTLAGCLCQIDFIDREVAGLEGVLSAQALAWPEVLRLMTVPGVDVMTAAAFMASVGEIGRFPTPKQLVGYLQRESSRRCSGSCSRAARTTRTSAPR